MTVVLFRKVWKPALLGLLLVLNCFAARNFILLSLDLLRGDGSAKYLSPSSTSSFQRIPKRSITRTHRAVGRLGADFAQVYFPAQDISHLEDAFDAKTTLDPWNRPSRYAPLIVLACAATFCKMSYGYASLSEMLFQILLFYGVLYWAFSECGLRKYFLYGVLLINLCLFLTPVGLSWFERGQFSLYLAAAYAVLMLSLLHRQPRGIAAAALLAFIKWTSFPPIFVILAVYLLSSQSLAELKSNIGLVAVFALTTISLLLLPMIFSRGTDLFLRGLMYQELNAVPKGISLLRYVPSLIVKAMPLAAIALGYINVRSNRAQSDWLIPYGAGVVAVMLTYPRLAYEYGLPSLPGFLPLLVFWARQDESAWNIPRMVLVIAFGVFVATASFSTRLFPSLLIVAEVYVLFSLILMLGPSFLALWGRLSSPGWDEYG